MPMLHSRTVGGFIHVSHLDPVTIKAQAKQLRISFKMGAPAYEQPLYADLDRAKDLVEAKTAE